LHRGLSSNTGTLSITTDSFSTVTDFGPWITGPSVYFYDRTIERVRSLPQVALAADDRLHELAYATLTAWGMHRMGEGVATKLTPFDMFRDALAGLVKEVQDLRGLSITNVTAAEAVQLSARLGQLVLRPGISSTGAPLVGNAKTLHFILPDLVPPIDRTYTLRFFFGYMTPPGSPKALFEKVFTPLHRLALRQADALRGLAGSYLCGGHAKGLDNAIVGYVLLHGEHFGKADLAESAEV